MSRISNRFAELGQRGEKALIAYITAGDPDLATTEALVYELEAAGADIVELGIPFSDPLVDGVEIQRASERGLQSGTNLDGIFATVRSIRRRSQVPLLLMTSYNPVFRYGDERAATGAREAGVDAFLITDLPPEEAAGWKQVSASNELDTIFLLAPTSTSERIECAASMGTGFIYCVSRTGVTGARAELPPGLKELIERIRAGTDQPIAVGFGISNAEQARQVTQWADGVAVGSAIVAIVGRRGRAAVPVVGQFVRELKAGCRAATGSSGPVSASAPAT
jgi:tryptophan synthase alpha chain